MIKYEKELNLKKALITILYTVVFNTVIGIILTALFKPFWHNFVYSQCIGILICICVLTLYHFIKTENLFIRLLGNLTALLIGSAGGFFLGTYFIEKNPLDSIFHYENFITTMFLGLIFGTIASYFFLSRERISQAEDAIREEKIKRLTSEKKTVESHLKFLQAQIEPHFLFNTLSNILSLLDTDLSKAKLMLSDFTHYLRLSLAKTRESKTTVSQEMEMIRIYIELFKARMGERLKYKIETGDHIGELSFPPMILQPLVENAIKHGIEPKVEGGEISIHVKRELDFLKLSITDTGLGFIEHNNNGISITNIRERLDTLHGNRASLKIIENVPCGTKVEIEVPIVEN